MDNDNEKSEKWNNISRVIHDVQNAYTVQASENSL